jgi:hypothetical protein
MPMRRLLAIVRGMVVLSVAACVTGPQVGVDGSHIFRFVAHPQDWATTTITLTDFSGLVAGVTAVDPTDLRLTDADWQELNGEHRVVVLIPGSNALGLTWSSGVCYPNQAVRVSGTAARLEILVTLGVPGASVCEAIGGGPALRLEMTTLVEVGGISLPEVK